MKRRERGSVLIEILVALAILAIGTVSLLSVVLESRQVTQRARERETTVVAASRLMDAISLWPREDLERRLGTRHQGEFQVRIQRSSHHVFDVAIGDSLDASMLATRLFRQ